jgi:hypothetical protein
MPNNSSANSKSKPTPKTKDKDMNKDKIKVKKYSSKSKNQSIDHESMKHISDEFESTSIGNDNDFKDNDECNDNINSDDISDDDNISDDDMINNDKINDDKINNDKINDDNINDDNNKISKFNMLMSSIHDVRKQIVDLQRHEKKLIKKLEIVHRSEVKKSKGQKRRTNTKATGFVIQKQVNGEFADWLGVERGTSLTGPEISKLFWKKMGEEGLKYEKDGRVLRTNNRVSKIFGVDSTVNDLTDPKDKNGFNIITYQDRIKYALENSNN